MGLFVSLNGCYKSDFDTLSKGNSLAAPINRIIRLPLDEMPKLSNDADKAFDDEKRSSQYGKELALSLDQCRAWGLRNNLSLKVARLAPDIEQENIKQLEGAFEPMFFTRMGFTKTDVPTSKTLDASQREYFNSSLGVQMPLLTGGDLSFSLPMSREKTDNLFSTLNPAYKTNARLSLRQPLLKDAGAKSAIYGITVANLSLKKSMANVKQEVISILTQIDTAYWSLYGWEQLLAVRQQEYDLAAAQYEQAKRKVDIDVIPQIEIIRAQSEMASRKQRIIEAKGTVAIKARHLKRLLNQRGLSVSSDTTLSLQTHPNGSHYEIDTEKLLKLAQKERPSLLRLNIELAESQLQQNLAKDRLKPDLSLSYTYTAYGLGSSAGGAYDVLETSNFGDHLIGLNFELPLGNQINKSKHRSAKIAQLTVETQRQQLSLQIETEVLDAVANLETKWQSLQASGEATILKLRQMESEARRFDLGLQSSTELLSAQTQYAHARSAEVTALANYQIAQINLALASGTLLAAAQIELDENGEDR